MNTPSNEFGSRNVDPLLYERAQEILNDYNLRKLSKLCPISKNHFFDALEHYYNAHKLKNAYKNRFKRFCSEIIPICKIIQPPASHTKQTVEKTEQDSPTQETPKELRKELKECAKEFIRNNCSPGIEYLREYMEGIISDDEIDRIGNLAS
ncbi:MAG: hypothetical protein KBC42_01330 [Candidatus Pacebacteria bacterium]|nr:hypothetical protein [Candidatus Paceibacterota bacterium]MBP9780548.1 hypothetical protein [Candidatus Paceibacterota bacterium]